MEFRLWIGLWTCLFLFLFVMFNLSFLVKYITRFTEDCFATLVAVIFIIDALKSIYKLKELTMTIGLTKMDANNDSNNLMKLINQTPYASENLSSIVYSRELQLRRAENDSTFYFSAILFLLTFMICMGLKSFLHMPYLTAGIRKFLSDFAVCISIVFASLLDYWMNLNTVKLTLPSVFEVSPDKFRSFNFSRYIYCTKVFFFCLSLLKLVETGLFPSILVATRYKPFSLPFFQQ